MLGRRMTNACAVLPGPRGEGIAPGLRSHSVTPAALGSDGRLDRKPCDPLGPPSCPPAVLTFTVPWIFRSAVCHRASPGLFSLSSLFTAVHVSSGLNPKARPQGHLTEAALLGDTCRCPPRPESMHSFLRINAKRPPPGCQAPFRVPGGEPWTRKAPCPA